MRLAHVMFATQVVSSKSDVQHLHDSCTQHETCRTILKHVLKTHDSRSHNQDVSYDLCLTRAARATKVAYDSRKKKSHRLNRGPQELPKTDERTIAAYIKMPDSVSIEVLGLWCTRKAPGPSGMFLIDDCQITNHKTNEQLPWFANNQLDFFNQLLDICASMIHT